MIPRTSITADNVEDIEFLLDMSEHPDRIAKRLGLKYPSIRDHLRRAGRLDLLDRWVQRTEQDADGMRTYRDMRAEQTA
jgi:hypothetical protein